MCETVPLRGCPDDTADALQLPAALSLVTPMLTPAPAPPSFPCQTLGNVLMLSSRLQSLSAKPHLSRQHEPAVAPSPAAASAPVAAEDSSGGGVGATRGFRSRVSIESDDEPPSPLAPATPREEALDTPNTTLRGGRETPDEHEGELRT